MSNAKRRATAHGSESCACGICPGVKRVAALPFFVSLTALVLVLCASSGARAYEDQASFALGLGYANAATKGLPARGAAVGATASWGLDDLWSIRGQLSYGYHPASAPLSVMLAGADIIYLIDIFSLVPYFGGGLDGIGMLRSGAFGADLGVHGAFGVDWLCSRSFALELEARPVLLLTALDRSPVYFTVMLSGVALLPL